MIIRGTSPKKAGQAASDLLKYCDTNHIKANQLINAELVKINNHLTDEALTTLVKLQEGRDLGVAAWLPKEANLQRHAALAKLYQGLAFLVLATFVLVIPLGLQSCGVKTGVVSNLDDLRPSVEYKSRPTQHAPEPSATPIPNSNVISQPQIQPQP